MQRQPGYSRRSILANTASLGVAMMLRPWTIKADEIDSRVADIVRTTIGIDIHNHVDVPLTAAELPGPDLDLSGQLKRSGLSAICMTFAVDYQSIRDPAEGYNRFINGLAAMDMLLARNGMQRALNLMDLRAAHAAGKSTVIQSIEGAHFLQGQLERIAEAHHRGLRHFGLLHDHDATPPLGDVFTHPAVLGGLTKLGAAVIRECERLGILIDLAHGNAKTVRDALKVSTKPCVISHTGLDTRPGNNERMARMMKPRLIDTDLAAEVASAGGVIGVWTHLADTPADFAENIRAMVDVAGIDHVCIGTDSKLTPLPTGRSQDGSTNQSWPGETAGFYYVVVDALLKAGFNAEEIAKIGGGNYCRVFDAATAGKV